MMWTWIILAVFLICAIAFILALHFDCMSEDELKDYYEGLKIKNKNKNNNGKEKTNNKTTNQENRKSNRNG